MSTPSGRCQTYRPTPIAGHKQRCYRPENHKGACDFGPKVVHGSKAVMTLTDPKTGEVTVIKVMENLTYEDTFAAPKLDVYDGRKKS